MSLWIIFWISLFVSMAIYFGASLLYMKAAFKQKDNYAGLREDYKNEFDFYGEWLSKQKCIDCGTKFSERKVGETWVTENQCRSCYEEHGIPEARGLSSATDEILRAKHETN